MAKSKLKAALQRQTGKDPVREKQLKQARKGIRKDGSKKKSADDSEDEVPELVDTSLLNTEAEEDEEGSDSGANSGSGSDKDSGDEEGEKDTGKEEEEAVEGSNDDKDEDEDEEEEEEEEDFALSDVDSDGDFEVPDIIPYQKLTIDNHNALKQLRKRIALPVSTLSFSDHQTIITSEPVEIPDIDDDLNRELAFYKQALSAAKSGREALKKEGVPFSRPTDYFAEMMKDDEHMGKIKDKLLGEAEGKKRAQEARKLRDLKKFGKQVQVAKLQEREKAKKETLDKIQILKRKRQGTDTDFTHENDMFDVALEQETKDARRGRDFKGGPKMKRQKRDEKYGFGGKKRFAKSNDAISSGDMTRFASRNKGGFGRGGGGAARGGRSGKTSRPGKSKRAAKR